MITTTFDNALKRAVLTPDPEKEINETAFFEQSEVINQYVAEGNELDSLMVVVEKYPYWEQFGKQVKNFVLDENVTGKIRKLALVTDNPVFDSLTNLMALLPETRMYVYSYCELEQATEWLSQTDEQKDVAEC